MQKENTADSPSVVFAFWVYLALAVPIALLFLKRGRDLPFTDGEAFLFVIPLSLASSIELITSVADNRLVKNRRLVVPVLFGTMVTLLVSTFFLLTGTVTGTAAAPSYEVAIFVFAIVYTIGCHVLAGDFDLRRFPTYGWADVSQFGRQLLDGLAKSWASYS